MIPNIKFALFDLDGTLVHSAPDLANAVNATLTQLGKPVYIESTIIQWVGNGAKRLLKRALTGTNDGEPDEEEFAHAFPIFMHHYEDNLSKATTIYPGVEQTLTVLKDAGIKLACVTNKPGKFTEPLLKEMQLADYFSVIVSGDTLPTLKPDPGQLLYACEQMGAPSQYAADYGVMVGDSANDILAAAAIGMPSVALTYGYAQGADLKKEGATHVIDNMIELIPLLDI